MHSADKKKICRKNNERQFFFKRIFVTLLLTLFQSLKKVSIIVEKN